MADTRRERTSRDGDDDYKLIVVAASNGIATPTIPDNNIEQCNRAYVANETVTGRAV